MKDRAESPRVTIGPIVIVDRRAETAEMLHLFFRLMELEPRILPLTPDLGAAADTIGSLDPAAVIVGLSPPALPLLDLARELRSRHPSLPVVLLSDADAPPAGFPTARTPRGSFEELLAVMEAVLG
jgi:DNA-binding NarL/FixJ family response regulator